MEKTHLLGKFLAWCFEIFTRVWMYVFTHRDDATVWSLSNFTKVLIGSAMTIATGLSALDVFDVEWSQGVKYMLILDAFVVVGWPIYFFTRHDISWFQRAYVDQQNWYNVFLLSDDYQPRPKASFEFYLWSLVAVVGSALVAQNWHVAQNLVIAFLALFILWTIYSMSKGPIKWTVYKIKNFDRIMNEYQTSSRENNELKAECDALKGTAEEQHHARIQEAQRIARLLITTRMHIEASKVEGIKSKHLAEARRIIKISLEKLPLNHDQLDLIELSVCRELGRAPEKQVSTSVAS